MDGQAWYIEMLRTPEWQAKRQEIYERDGYTCVDCEEFGIRINCHHTYYVKGMSPWQYPPEALVTLCDVCHEKRHKVLIESYASHEDAANWIAFAEAQAYFEEELLSQELEKRRMRIAHLLHLGATWDGEGRYFGYVDKSGQSRFYDEDGYRMG